MMGASIEFYKWAVENRLEVPLLIFSFIALIISTVIVVNLENEPCFTSLCRFCIYEKKRQGCYSLTCSLYKPKILFVHKRRTQCPFEELINEAKYL